MITQFRLHFLLLSAAFLCVACDNDKKDEKKAEDKQVVALEKSEKSSKHATGASIKEENTEGTSEEDVSSEGDEADDTEIDTDEDSD